MNSSFIKTRIRHDLRLVYCDLPKCASTSIKNAMFPGISDKQIGYHQGESWQDTDYFTFTFVRCPYERVASNFSMYANWGDMSNSGRNSHPSVPTDDMDQFMTWVESNLMTNIHLVPQHMFVPEKLDFVGKMESLIEDWLELQEKYDLPNLEFWNVSKNRPNSKTVGDLTLEQKQRIRELYAEDFKRFYPERTD